MPNTQSSVWENKSRPALLTRGRWTEFSDKVRKALKEPKSPSPLNGKEGVSSGQFIEKT